jgi:hypothetical protein
MYMTRDVMTYNEVMKEFGFWAGTVLGLRIDCWKPSELLELWLGLDDFPRYLICSFFTFAILGSYCTVNLMFSCMVLMPLWVHLMTNMTPTGFNIAPINQLPRSNTHTRFRVQDEQGKRNGCDTDRCIER